MLQGLHKTPWAKDSIQLNSDGLLEVSLPSVSSQEASGVSGITHNVVRLAETLPIPALNRDPAVNPRASSTQEDIASTQNGQAENESSIQDHNQQRDDEQEVGSISSRNEAESKGDEPGVSHTQQDADRDITHDATCTQTEIVVEDEDISERL